MAYTKKPPTVWTEFLVKCGNCEGLTPAADAVHAFQAGGCETCEYSTYFIECAHCKAREGSDW